MENKELHQKLNTVIDDYKKSELENKEQKEHTTEALYTMKALTLDTIEELSKELTKQRAVLSEINEAICLVNSHTFDTWEEHEDKYLDRSWYYTRKCIVCGSEEKTLATPDEYFVRITKNGEEVKKYIKRY